MHYIYNGWTFWKFSSSWLSFLVYFWESPKYVVHWLELDILEKHICLFLPSNANIIYISIFFRSVQSACLFFYRCQSWPKLFIVNILSSRFHVFSLLLKEPVVKLSGHEDGEGDFFFLRFWNKTRIRWHGYETQPGVQIPHLWMTHWSWCLVSQNRKSFLVAVTGITCRYTGSKREGMLSGNLRYNKAKPCCRLLVSVKTVMVLLGKL